MRAGGPYMTWFLSLPQQTNMVSDMGLALKFAVLLNAWWVASAPQEAATPAQACACVTPRLDKTGIIFVEGSTNAALAVDWAAAGGERSYSILLSPAAGIYVSNDFYARLGFNFEWDRGGSDNAFSAGAVPSFGVYIPMGPHLAFAPWVGINLGYQRSNSANATSDGLSAAVEASLSLVIPVVEHFNLSVGPDLQQRFYARESSKSGRLAVTCGVIGWW